jgi:hypothetical protein
MNSLPDGFLADIEEQVEKLNASHETDALIERDIGGLVDEVIATVPHGERMTLYNEVAAAIRSVASRGEYRNVSGRSVRYWRRTFAWMNAKGNLYPELSGSLVNAGVRIATICDLDPEYVCEWLMATGTRQIDALEAHFLPQTSSDYQIDHPVISGLLRGINKNWQSHPRMPRLLRLVNLLRAEIKAIQEKGL